MMFGGATAIQSSGKEVSLGMSIKRITDAEALAQEARKYKSADEFIKAQTPLLKVKLLQLDIA